MKKRILSVLLAVCLVVSMLVVPAAAATVDQFGDLIEGEWYYEYAERVIEKGLFIGTSDTTFEPATDMSRAMMVTVLYRLANGKVQVKPGETHNFSDVKDGTWYTDAVIWAANRGIVLGDGEGHFLPDTPISREQMCTIVARFLTYIAEYNSVSFEHLRNGNVVQFTDADSIAGWAKDGVKTCQEYGLVNGFYGISGLQFGPKVTFTRAQSLKILCLLCDIFENGKDVETGDYTLTVKYVDEAGRSIYTTGTYAVTAGAQYNAAQYRYNISGYTYKGLASGSDAISGTMDGDKTVTFVYAESDDHTDPIYNYTLTYKAWDAKQGKVADFKEETAASTDTTYTFTVTDEIPANYEVNGKTYAFIGWDISASASTVELKAGDSVELTSTDNEEVLYAVYIPADDYILQAMQGLVEDANVLIEKVNNTTITAGSHDVTVGNYVSAGEAELNTSTYTVNVTVNGELNYDTILKLIETATVYAVEILGNEEPPTVDEVKDVVKDVAESVGITLTGKSLEEVAEEVKAKLASEYATLAGNFRNCDTDGDGVKDDICINRVSIMNGNTTVASLKITNENGFVSEGKEANLSAAKSLAAAIARAMYADLKTTENQPSSTVKMNTSLTIKFGTDLPGYTGVGAYSTTYYLNLNLVLTSDVFRYSYDPETNVSTLTLVISEELQEQYASSLDRVLQATLANGTVKEEVTKLADRVIGNLDLLDELKAQLAPEDRAQFEADLKAALNAWILANMEGTGNDNAYTPYEFLWTNEGDIIVLPDGTYSTGDSKVLGVNDALYALVDDVAKNVMTDLVKDNLTADVITGSAAFAEMKNQLPANYPLDEMVENAVDTWIERNVGETAYVEGSTETAYIPYDLLAKGGKVEYDATTDTYSLTIGEGKMVLGVNDALYALVDVLFKDAVNNAINNSLTASVITDKVGSQMPAGYDTAKIDEAIAAWKAANTAADAKGNETVMTPYEFLAAGNTVVKNGDTYTTSNGVTLGYNTALQTMFEDLYSAILKDVIGGVNSDVLAGTLTPMNTLLGEAAVKAIVDPAFAAWQKANVEGDNTDEAYTLYNYLIAGESVIDNGDGTYSLTTTDGKTLGVNGELHAMMVELCEQMAVEIAKTAVESAKESIGEDGWNSDLITDEDRLSAITVAINGEFQKYDLIKNNIEFNKYLLDLCKAEGAKIIGTEQSIIDGHYSAAVAKQGVVYDMVDDLLVENICTKTAGNEYVGLDAAERANLIDQMLLETVYNKTTTGSIADMLGKDLHDMIDQMVMEEIYNKTTSGLISNLMGKELHSVIDQTIMETLATATVRGKTLGQYMDYALKFKTIDGMKNLSLNSVAAMLNHATVQETAAKYGNEYVHYVATAISKLPASASVVIDGVELSEAALAKVSEAAANNDAAGACAALADVIESLNLSMASFADGRMITVNYGERSFSVIFQIEIEPVTNK